LKPVGYILSLEGADSIITINHLERAYDYGLRALGPAHYGPGRYANGTDATGLMGPNGLALLKEMERLNIILDATHLCDDSFWQALDHFNGHIWASHNNCRALVNHNRQYSDEQIKELVRRGAVIGAALDAWMMVPAWIRGVSKPKEMNCNLEVMPYMLAWVLTSTALLEQNSVLTTSKQLLTCKNSAACWQIGDILKPILKIFCIETGSGFYGQPGSESRIVCLM
jgi:microsomal dipeptidase-like Zn-dependent dipeptidase